MLVHLLSFFKVLSFLSHGIIHTILFMYSTEVLLKRHMTDTRDTAQSADKTRAGRERAVRCASATLHRTGHSHRSQDTCRQRHDARPRAEAAMRERQSDPTLSRPHSTAGRHDTQHDTMYHVPCTMYMYMSRAHALHMYMSGAHQSDHCRPP